MKKKNKRVYDNFPTTYISLNRYFTLGFHETAHFVLNAKTNENSNILDPDNQHLLQYEII